MAIKHKKRILIVDDEEDLTWSISRGLLKNQSALEVICANSGKSAFNLLKKDKFDLLVTDIRMPGGNGLSLLMKVKKDFPKMKVIVMTAYGSSEIKELLNKTKTTGYIEKPFEFKELKDLIFNALEKDKNKLLQK